MKSGHEYKLVALSCVAYYSDGEIPLVVALKMDEKQTGIFAGRDPKDREVREFEKAVKCTLQSLCPNRKLQFVRLATTWTFSMEGLSDVLLKFAQENTHVAYLEM